MKSTEAAALSATREFTVDRERTIDFMGEDARVYATPMLVRDIEVTCRDLLAAHVEASDGKDTICRGRHARFVVDVEQAKKRLKQKQAA